MRALFVTENTKLSNDLRASVPDQHILEIVRSPEVLEKIRTLFPADCVVCDTRFFPTLKPRFDSPFLLLASEQNSSTWTELLKDGADGIVFENCNSEAVFAQLNSFTKCCGKRNSMRRFFPKLDLLIDLERYLIEIHGESLDVTLTELKIMRELTSEDGQIVPRRLLTERALHQFSPSARSLDVHVCSLRRKLRKYGIGIEPIRGIGYRLVHFETRIHKIL